jgi:hypothetical protein
VNLLQQASLVSDTIPQELFLLECCNMFEAKIPHVRHGTSYGVTSDVM